MNVFLYLAAGPMKVSHKPPHILRIFGSLSWSALTRGQAQRIVMFNLGKEKMEVPRSWSFCPWEKKGRETGRERVIVERAVMTSGVTVLRGTFYFIAYILRHYIQFDSFKISEVGKLIYYLQLTLQTWFRVARKQWEWSSGFMPMSLYLLVFI